MGLSGWLARKGNVGGTARWAGKGYWLFKKEHPDATIEQVMEALVSARYTSASSRREREALLSTIAKGQVRGLAHLVANILSVEAGFQENTIENRQMFLSVIREELERLEIPASDIFKIGQADS